MAEHAHTGQSSHQQSRDHAQEQDHDDNHDHNGGHDHGNGHRHHEIMFRNRFWANLLLTIPVLLFSPTIQEWFNFTMPQFAGSQFIVPVFSIIIFVYGGLPFLKMAIPEVKEREPGMMTLISLAIIVAFGFSLFAFFTGASKSFFWEMATLIVIMLLGHWMEMRSIRHAEGALDELAKLMPDTAEVVTEDDKTKEVAVTDLEQGDVLLVRPGASIPADGEIVEGQSDLDESMITGESQPVSKSEGDEVIGGTINGDGSLRVKVTATGDETALAGIMRLVEDAQSSKSKTQILADRAAGWLFYIAIGTAIITTIAWTIAVGFEITVIERVATVLVIACPHALGLAIPLVVAISTSMGANNGILIRDRTALEQARLVDMVVFDKTGTLTKGDFGVVDMATISDWDETRALSLANAMEADSEHPIARGIRDKAESVEITEMDITDFEAIKGRGIKATHDGQSVYMGGPRLLEHLDLSLSDALKDFRQTANDNAHTVIYLIVDETVVAGFALADVIRDESQQVIDELHDLDIEVAMLTGDSQQVADRVARELGIDTVFAEVLPEHKDEKITQLQDEGKTVAMVGDGVNDAPALTRADIGIAIGSGTDVAIESAGIILVKSNPLDVLKIFQLSHATYNKMIQNLIWATGYNVVALPLAAGILAPIGFILSPAVGAALMSLSTVVVAINAQFLRRTELTGKVA